MPLNFAPYQQRSFRSQGELSATLNDVLSTQVDQTFTDLPINSALRISELARANRGTVRIGADLAKQRIADAGLEGRLSVPDEGIAEDALKILISRKTDEVKRQNVLSRAPGGVGATVAKFGTAFAVSMLDPLNVGLAFVPVVGQTRYLRMLANASSTAGRVAVRAGVGAVEGATGAAILEPLIASAKYQEQADYTMANSLLNIAFGAGFGGGLHVTFGGIAAAVRKASGKKQIYDGLRGLDEDEIATVLNFRREAAAGRLAEPRDLARVLETYTPATRAAIAEYLPPSGSAASRVEAAPLGIREGALRTALGQAMAGKRIDVDPILAESRGETVPVATEARAAGSPPRADAPQSVVIASPDQALPPLRDGESYRVDIQRPLEVEAAPGTRADDFLAFDTESLSRQMREGGYDGVVVRDSTGGTAYLAASADQVTAAPVSRPPTQADISAAASRQDSPEADISSDFRASEAAEQEAAAAPKAEEDRAANEAALADELAELKDVARIAGQDEQAARALEDADQAIKDADTYAKAARAAALCGIAH